MYQAKKYYDRRIKKNEYEIGDSVLVNHSSLKKGLSRGLAPRYYRPFKIVGKNTNGCGYLIRDVLALFLFIIVMDYVSKRSVGDLAT